MLAGGFKRRMLNRRETTAVASANAAMAVKEPRRFQIADINNSAIQIVADAANHAVTGWPRTTLKPHPIMIIATAKITRLRQRAESSILIAPVPLLPFDWRELTISSFSANNILGSPACWSLVDLGDAYLLQQHQIVLDVPIVGDAAVLDLDEVSGDEGDRLAFALRLPEPAGEMAGEIHMHGDVVAGDDHLLHRNLEVGHGGAEPARGEGRSFRSLRPVRWQRVIDEVRRDGFLQQGLVAGIPEIVECADCLHGRLALRVGDRHGNDEVVDLDAVGKGGGRGHRKRQRGEKLDAACKVQGSAVLLRAGILR